MGSEKQEETTAIPEHCFSSEGEEPHSSIAEQFCSSPVAEEINSSPTGNDSSPITEYLDSSPITEYLDSSPITEYLDSPPRAEYLDSSSIAEFWSSPIAEEPCSSPLEEEQCPAEEHGSELTPFTDRGTETRIPAKRSARHPIEGESCCKSLRNGIRCSVTTKKIGFLGLGQMGQRMVKGLMGKGHNLTVWNRTACKCDPFVERGASKGETPSRVVASCDIIFCCLSDESAVRSVVYGDDGVLRGLKGSSGSKGYVELTSMSPEVYETVRADLGIKYLAAPFVGSRTHAEPLSILSAGDPELFKDCESCFSVVTDVFYIGSEVGDAVKMNAVASLLKGTTFGALSEAMVLVDRCGVPAATFLEILGQTPLNPVLLLERGRAMLQMKDYFSDATAKRELADLRLAMSLANDCDQTLHVASAAHVFFELARRRRRLTSSWHSRVKK